jgi:hypothetical protein
VAASDEGEIIGELIDAVEVQASASVAGDNVGASGYSRNRRNARFDSIELAIVVDSHAELADAERIGIEICIGSRRNLIRVDLVEPGAEFI